MKNKSSIILFLLFIILSGLPSFGCAAAPDSITSVEIADSFIKLYPDTVAYKTEAKSYKWNYEQGLMLEAFYRIWKKTGDQKYFDYVKKNIDYYVADDGSIKTYKLNDFTLDNISPGRVLLHLYDVTKEKKYKKAADTLMKQLQMQPRTKSGGFWHKKVYPYQMWLDGLFMAEPFYAAYVKMSGNDPAGYNDIIHQFMLIKQHLIDPATGLYYHGWDESRQQKWADSAGRSPNFWDRSIGWFIMSLVDVIDYIPEENRGRDSLILILKNLSESLLRFRDPETKLWYLVVDKGSKPGNYIETSGSAMFIYAFAKGANKGWLDKKFYTAAQESFSGLCKNFVTIQDYALYLNNVVSVGGLGGKPYRDGSFEYYISEPKRINDFKGYGPFLLAAIELGL